MYADIRTEASKEVVLAVSPVTGTQTLDSLRCSALWCIFRAVLDTLSKGSLTAALNQQLTAQELMTTQVGDACNCVGAALIN